MLDIQFIAMHCIGCCLNGLFSLLDELDLIIERIANVFTNVFSNVWLC